MATPQRRLPDSDRRRISPATRKSAGARGCGDYSILAQMKKVLPTLGIPREKMVFVSGIGCSSRFPYYMNTYGFHTHPRPGADLRHRAEGRPGPTCRSGSSPATATACRSAATT